MATISITRVNTGDTIQASDHNNMANIVETAINGGIEDVNIKAGANIALSKLASGGATSGQVMQWSGSTWAPADAASTTLGVVAEDVSTSNFGTYTTEQTVHSFSFTAVADRKYRITWTGTLFSNEGEALDTLRLKLDGTTINSGSFLTSGSAAVSFTLIAYAEPSAGSRTVTATVGRATGTVGHTMGGSATSPRTVLVEDIGEAS